MAHYVRAIDQMTNHTAADLRSALNDFIDQEGVLDLAGGHYEVTEKGTPDMSVDVAAGIAYILNDSFTEFASSQHYWDTLLDASTNVSISSNASGSTRYDIVCIKINTAATPDANASNVASIVVVEGTPGAGVPATPSNHLKLAEITIASGETAITNSEIADTRQAVLLDPDKINTPADFQTITYSATPTVDWSVASTAHITLTGNATFTFSGGLAGRKYVLIIKQDATGSRTITLPASVRTGLIGTPTLTTTANKTDYLGFVYNGIDSKYDLVAYSLNH